MVKIKGVEGVDRRTMGKFCVAVVQAVSFWVRDVGSDPPTGEGPHGFPTLGGTEDGRHGP